jgi:oligosaccharide repeat unit polymerase
LILVTSLVRPGEAGTGTISTLCLALTVSFAWACWSWWRVNGTLFDPYGMFMSSLFLFNAGQAPLELFGLNERGILNGKFDDGTVVATLYMALLGFNFAHLGALLALRRQKPPRKSRWTIVDGQALRTVGWLLLAISIAPSAYLIWNAVNTVMSGGYRAVYERDVPIGVSAAPQVIAMFIVPAALLLLAGADGRRREKVVSAAVIGLHTIGQLFLGYRSTAIMPACAFLWLWHRSEWRIKTRWLAFAIVLVMMVVIPISREMRGLAGPDRTRLGTFISIYRSIDNPIVSSISEMGTSMTTIAYTYDLVPATRSFDYGVGYAYAALTIVPNLFWAVHPTIAHGTASDWLVWAVDPYGAMRQAGLGYSCIAEVYLNFGWVGVPVVMCLVGFGVAAFANLGSDGHRARLALVAVFTAFALRFPRDETASLVRIFVWYSWMPLAAATFMARLGARQAIVKSAMRTFDLDVGPSPQRPTFSA